MSRNGSLNSSTTGATLRALALLSVTALLAHAATPFDQATVTRLQNKVSYGEQQGAQSVTRPAAVSDVIQARNFLLTENDARAELKYPDGSIVRIGQNTVFSFEADSRTLSLSKGSLIFYIPKGQGGGVIKTPSLTAAITGTVGKVSENTIAILEGSIKLIPSGEIVSAGQFARRNANGTITVDFFDRSKALDGKLIDFGGPLPPFAEEQLIAGPALDLSAIGNQESRERTAIGPSALRNFFPEVNFQRPGEADRPRNQPTVRPRERLPERPRPEY